MSAAIKRLSTIIRPSTTSPPPSPPEAKNSIDAPAPAAAVDTAVAETAPTEAKPNGTTTDAVKDVENNAAPEQGEKAEPASTEAPKDAASSTETPADKEATAPAPVGSKKEKNSKATHRRDPRDIGRSTIRRFSTILRSQAKDGQKDKGPVPPLPSQENAAKPAEGETKAPEGEEQAPAATESPQETKTKEADKENAAPAEKDAKPTKPAPAATKDKSDGSKVGKRRSASFFTAAREGLQRTAKDVQTRARGQPGATKAKPSPKAEVVPKIVKKGAANGKRVVVVTGASKGVGLEFVKHFASQPNTFVIALARTADKSALLKPIISASAKEGHNVRAIKLDVASSRSIHNVTKDIVELTDGRIDMLINAAGTRGDPALKVWDLKGNELEEELRNNLVGPIAFTNALIPYLKPMPPKEEKKEEKAEPKEETEAGKDEKTEEKVEEKKDDKAEEKKDEKSEEKGEPNAETAETAAAPVEKGETKEANGQEPSVVAATTAEASVATPADNQETAAPVTEIKDEKPVDAQVTEPVVAEELPSILPAQPFVIFLAPADPVQNVEGTVPTGSSFAPSPRTLFSLSRAALQVAIAKYAVGLGAMGVGIVGVERPGLDDPHSGVSDVQAAESVAKLLPELSVRDNGKLIKASA